MANGDAGRAFAERIERENARWMVIFGVFSGQFVAFPRFATSMPLRIESRDPAEVVRQMRAAERHYLGQRNRVAPAAKGGEEL